MELPSCHTFRLLVTDTYMHLHKVPYEYTTHTTRSTYGAQQSKRHACSTPSCNVRVASSSTYKRSLTRPKSHSFRKGGCVPVMSTFAGFMSRYTILRVWQKLIASSSCLKW